MKLTKFLIGLVLGCLLLALPLSQWQPDGLESLRSLTVQLDGRKKPLDTVAQETVAKIHGSTTYKQADGTKDDALSTYLAMWFNTRNWNEEPFVLVSYRPLKEAAGIDLERKHFTFQELMANRDLAAIVSEAHRKELNEADLSRNEREALTIESRLNLLYQSVGDRQLPIVPHPDDIKGKWAGLDGAAQLYTPETTAPLMASFAMMQQTLLQGGTTHVPMVSAFVTELKAGLKQLSPDIYPADAVMNREVHFNHFHPFAKAWQLYAIAFVVLLVSQWITRWNLYWSAIGLFTAGIGVQTYGFFANADR